MKKYLLSFAVMMGATLFTGCLSDNDNNNNRTVDYIVTKGALVINNGNAYNGIDGSLTFIDFSTDPANVQQDMSCSC